MKVGAMVSASSMVAIDVGRLRYGTAGSGGGKRCKSSEVQGWLMPAEQLFRRDGIGDIGLECSISVKYVHDVRTVGDRDKDFQRDTHTMHKFDRTTHSRGCNNCSPQTGTYSWSKLFKLHWLS